MGVGGAILLLGLFVGAQRLGAAFLTRSVSFDVARCSAIVTPSVSKPTALAAGLRNV